MKYKPFIVTVSKILALGVATLAYAQGYPSRPITIVIGASPGSTTDGLVRTLGQEIAKETGQPVIVDNKPGANGIIAAQFVAHAQPDGYTVFVTTNTTQAANPHLYKKLAYDPVKDFAPVTALVKGYLLMVLNPKVPANSVSEFIAYSKQKPGKLSFGAGTSSARVAVEQFQQMTGTELLYVPYKANPQAVTDLIAGQVDMMIVDLTTSLPHVQSGKLKGLAVTSMQRSPLAPSLPTLDEAGVKGYEMSFWNAAYVPAKTPESIVRRLNELLVNAMGKESVKAFVAKFGMEVYVSTPAELAKFQAAETVRWGEIIKRAGIQPE
ncbi:MAG: tripartite tricarboxylate transporter substrate binding protein [Burkholderiales bacterium]